MGRSISEIMASFSPERQKLIRDQADKLIQEYKALKDSQ